MNRGDWFAGEGAHHTNRPGKSSPPVVKWWLIAAAGLVVAAIAVVAVLSVKKSIPNASIEIDLTSGGQPVDPTLAAAVRALHFHSTMSSLVGIIEDKPISEAKPATAHTAELLPIGSIAPAFSLKTAIGREVSLSDYRGKVVLLMFFTTWCPHCQAEAKHLNGLFAAMSATNAAILAINVDGEDAASVYAFERYFEVSYPTLLDPSSRPGNFNHRGEPGSVSKAYRIGAFPTFYVLNGKGQISWRAEKEQPDALIQRELQVATGH